MRVKALITENNSAENWEEEFTVSSVEKAKEEVQSIVDDFNEYKRKIYGKKHRTRKLIKIIEQTQDEHQWVKQAVVFNDRIAYICSKCHLKKTVPASSLSVVHGGKCYPDRVCTICNREYKSAENCRKHKEKYHKG